MPWKGDDIEMVEVTVTVTKPVAKQIEAAAKLTGQSPEEFAEEGILTQLQALDNVLHNETNIDIPDDFDVGAWRRRYEEIRREG